MDRLDVLYERLCMATIRKVYFTKMLDSPHEDNQCHDTPFSSKNLQEAVSRVMVVTEEEEKDTGRNVDNVIMDTLF